MWLKQVGCECVECGPAPCTGADCICNLSLNTDGGDAGYDETFDVTGQFPTAQDLGIDLETYTIQDELLIYADGTLVYDSGCIGAHVTTAVSIPAGTTSIRVVIVPDCAGGTGTLWTLSLSC